jgi:steroid 5-alpha reductase family enzyme
MPFLTLVACAILALASLAAIMAGAWAIQRRTGNSGWIDAAWSVGVGVVAASLALSPAGAGALWRQAAVAGFVGAWSLRLGLHIVSRTRKTSDDPRYRKLMDDWGAAAPLRLFLFLQTQAVAGAVLAVAAALAAHAPGASVRPQDVLGFALLALAIAGEARADAELARFRADPAHRGAICDAGLWRRSRHPNYVCEFLVWVAVAIVAFEPAAPLSWLALIAPAMMYATLRYASGIPLLEQHMLRTRPEAFAAYAARTPVFFPRLP